VKTENDELEQVSPGGTEEPSPTQAQSNADDRPNVGSVGEVLMVLAPLALVGYLVAQSANPVELASVTTAASGLLVAVATAISTLRRRR
jgi:hypothetical protein